MRLVSRSSPPRSGTKSRRAVWSVRNSGFCQVVTCRHWFQSWPSHACSVVARSPVHRSITNPRPDAPVAGHTNRERRLYCGLTRRCAYRERQRCATLFLADQSDCAQPGNATGAWTIIRPQHVRSHGEIWIFRPPLCCPRAATGDRSCSDDVLMVCRRGFFVRRSLAPPRLLQAAPPSLLHRADPGPAEWSRRSGRVERPEANDRLAPPLIKPDGRFSRIRLSEGHSLTSLLRHRPCPSRPRGQPIQAVAFPEELRAACRP